MSGHEIRRLVSSTVWSVLCECIHSRQCCNLYVLHEGDSCVTRHHETYLVAVICDHCLFNANVRAWNAVVMVALCNRADHYIFALWFLSFFFLLSSFFFPRLISAAVDCMSTILPHMVWP